MANNSYDLIITDLEMEGGTRADMIGMIRWRHNIGDLLIPIVVFSTNTTRRLIQGGWMLEPTILSRNRLPLRRCIGEFRRSSRRLLTSFAQRPISELTGAVVMVRTRRTQKDAAWRRSSEKDRKRCLVQAMMSGSRLLWSCMIWSFRASLRFFKRLNFN